MENTAPTTKLTRTCPLCGKTYSMEFDSVLLNKGMEAYKNHALVQYAFPTFTKSQREFLMTGICDDCWNSLKEE